MRYHDYYDLWAELRITKMAAVCVCLGGGGGDIK